MISSFPLPRRQVLQGAAALTLSSLSFMSQSQGNPASTPVAAPTPKRVIFVVSNEVNPGPAGFSIGYYLTELAHPYWAFQQRGYTMDIASPNGGRAVHDAMSCCEVTWAWLASSLRLDDATLRLAGQDQWSEATHPVLAWLERHSRTDGTGTLSIRRSVRPSAMVRDRWC